MSKFYFILFFIIFSFPVFSQENIELSTGSDYQFQSFYNLSDNEEDILTHNEWDIAFSITDGSAGVHINEGAPINFNGSPNAVYLYKAPTNNFEDVIQLPIETDSLFNLESDWDFGAFNYSRDKNDPLDYGWGLKVSGTNNIMGNKVFVLKQRDFTWIKIQITSLIDGIFTIKYANLDGSNEQELTVNEADYSSNGIARISIRTNRVLSPDIDWDIFISRYFDVQDAGGVLVQQGVLGILSAPGVTIAQVDNIDIETVEYNDYLEDFSSDMTTIGWDWKFWNNGYTLIDNRVYFIKLKNDDIWKVNFTRFGGYTNGDIDFTKTYMGNLSSTSVLEDHELSINMFPNPSHTNDLFISFDNEKKTRPIEIEIYDISGRLILSNKYKVVTGYQVISIPTSTWNTGTYFIKTQVDHKVETTKYTKQ